MVEFSGGFEATAGGDAFEGQVSVFVGFGLIERDKIREESFFGPLEPKDGGKAVNGVG